MAGYLDPKNSDKIKKAKQYHDMGDVVKIDSEDYLIITGRVKRFIKIAGEMVSLNLVESYIRKISQEKNHAVISLINKDSQENLILFTDDKELTKDKITKLFKEQNIGTIFAPRNIEYRKNIPILNTGKIDYTQLEKFGGV